MSILPELNVQIQVLSNEHTSECVVAIVCLFAWNLIDLFKIHPEIQT